MKTLITFFLALFSFVGFSQISIVKDINPGSSSSYINGSNGCDGQIFYFNAKDETNGIQLWRSDGTEQGTFLLKIIYQSPNNTLISNFESLNGSMFFIGGSSPKLWKSDGTTDGTTAVKDFGSNSFFDPPAFFQLGNNIFFNGAVSATGQELWRTDGTQGGTVLVKDIYSGANHSRPSNFGSFNGNLFFTARTPSEGTELWISNGTEQGTKIVKDINPGSNSSNIRNLISTPIGVFFQADDGTNGSELWVSDGTEMGTHFVKDLNPNGNGFTSNQGSITHAYTNGKVVFSATTPATGLELFVTDGTENGTQLLKEFSPGSGSGLGFINCFPYNSKVVFTAIEPNFGLEPWITDGTSDGTTRLSDINPGSGSSNPSGYAVQNGILYFVAATSSTGSELWSSDGTDIGTKMVIDLLPGSNGSSLDKLASCNDLLFFYGNDGVHGSELFRSGIISNVISPNKTRTLELAPNPASHWVRLQVEGNNSEESLLQIFNQIGQLVKTINISNGQGCLIDVSALKNGIYILRFSNEEGIYSGKLHIE